MRLHLLHFVVCRRRSTVQLSSNKRYLLTHGITHTGRSCDYDHDYDHSAFIIFDTDRIAQHDTNYPSEPHNHTTTLTKRWTHSNVVVSDQCTDANIVTNANRATTNSSEHYHGAASAGLDKQPPKRVALCCTYSLRQLAAALCGGTVLLAAAVFGMYRVCQRPPLGLFINHYDVSQTNPVFDNNNLSDEPNGQGPAPDGSIILHYM